MIQAVCLPRRTGTLWFARGAVSKSIYIKDGQLIFATSNVAEERLGEILLRSGAIGYQQLERALSLLGGGKRLGVILVELGDITPPNLVRGLLHQVKEIILSLFSWESGSYSFEEGSLPTAEVITLNISTSKLICDGIRRITSWPRIVRNVGRSPTIYKLTREGRLLAEDLDLGSAERLMLELLEKPTTVADVCRSVFLPNFDVYQYLWAFRILGIVDRIEPKMASFDVDPSHPAEWQGNLRDLSVGPVLLKICRSGQTGVLFLSRDEEERSIHIRRGVIAFSTSNRSDDSLTTFLLRRGVIALRDKEEIERRLLSNKRAGTILREMGILSNEELIRYVREQLRETVLSTFSWDQGDWRFVSGELPTFEDITLDRPVEELIFQGVRVVRDWSSIRNGCGAPNTLLRKVGEGEGLAPGVEPGSDEAEILASLETPRTVASLCESTQLPDYRVAQILWALQTVGRVERGFSEDRIAEPPGQHAACDTTVGSMISMGSKDEAKRYSVLVQGPDAQGVAPSSEPGDVPIPQADSVAGPMAPGEAELQSAGPEPSRDIPADQDSTGWAWADDSSFGRTGTADHSATADQPPIEEHRTTADRAPITDQPPIVDRSTTADRFATPDPPRTGGPSTTVDPSSTTTDQPAASASDIGIPLSGSGGLEPAEILRSVAYCEGPREDSVPSGSHADPQKIDMEEAERRRAAEPASTPASAEPSFDGYLKESLERLHASPDSEAPPAALDDESFEGNALSGSSRFEGIKDSSETVVVQGIKDSSETVEPARDLSPDQTMDPESSPGGVNPLRVALGFLRKQAKSHGAGEFLRDTLSKLSTAKPASSKDAPDRRATARTTRLGAERDRRSSSRKKASGSTEPRHEGPSQPYEHDVARGTDPESERQEASRIEGAREHESSSEPTWPKEAAVAVDPVVQAARPSETPTPEAGVVIGEPVEDDEIAAARRPSISPLEAVGTGVLEEIERFNRRHREVYAVLKGAVGAGARNFVGTCIKRLPRPSCVFSDVEMDESGAFSSASLYEQVGSLSPSTIRERLESLIEAEADTARELLESRTVQKMYRRLEAAISESVTNTVP